MAYDDKFDEKDQFRRKLWIFYAFIYCIGLPCVLLVLENFTSLHIQKENLTRLNPLLLSILNVIVGVISFVIPYHCAYKKCGIKWLTFMITYWVITNIVALNFLRFGQLDVVIFFFWMFGFMFSCGWFVVSWNLRRTNRKIQLKTKFPEIAKSCVEILDQSSSLEALNKNLYHLMQLHAFLEPILFDAYQGKKSLLKRC